MNSFPTVGYDVCSDAILPYLPSWLQRFKSVNSEYFHTSLFNIRLTLSTIFSALLLSKWEQTNTVNAVKFLYKIQFFRLGDLFKKASRFSFWQFSAKHIINIIDCFSDSYIFNEFRSVRSIIQSFPQYQAQRYSFICALYLFSCYNDRPPYRLRCAMLHRSNLIIIQIIFVIEQKRRL